MHNQGPEGQRPAKKPRKSKKETAQEQAILHGTADAVPCEMAGGDVPAHEGSGLPETGGLHLEGDVHAVQHLDGADSGHPTQDCDPSHTAECPDTEGGQGPVEEPGPGEGEAFQEGKSSF